MIRNVSEILSDLGQKYRQPQMKLRQMTLRGEITQVIRGLYETDKNTPGEALAGAIYGPSYLSFPRPCISLLPHHSRRTRPNCTRRPSASFRIPMSRPTSFRTESTSKTQKTGPTQWPPVKRPFATSSTRSIRLQASAPWKRSCSKTCASKSVIFGTWISTSSKRLPPCTERRIYKYCPR